MLNPLVQTLPVLNDAPTPSTACPASGIEKPAVSTESETAKLTRAIVAGDETAFAQFYDLYSGRLFGFLLVLTSGQEQIATEMHQVVMIKVARKFRVFRADEELWAWLAQVARHAFIDHIRQQNRRSEHLLSEPALDALQAQDIHADKHLMEWLDDGLQTLDGEDRALVESVYFHDRAHKDVAAESGQTAKAIESRLARIRARLRHFILTKLRHERKAT